MLSSEPRKPRPRDQNLPYRMAARIRDCFLRIAWFEAGILLGERTQRQQSEAIAVQTRTYER